ncbi:MAG: TOMM precursor leader peptide-binding protein, partial [Candidatus Binatia bacterium]
MLHDSLSCSQSVQSEANDPRPQLKPWLRWEVVPSEGVIVLSERGHFLLRGDIYTLLTPLLDGQHTVEEIIACLQGQASASEVFIALMRLRSKGYIVDAPPSLSLQQAAFWDALEIDSANVVQRLRNATVSIVSFGAIDPTPFHILLTSLGVRVDDNSERWVVLTDDYLHDGLAAFNQDALTHDRSWLLVKPVGIEIWIGPLFLPERTGCWECLAQRIRGARKVQHYLQERKKQLTAFPFPQAALPSTVQTAYSLAATETVKWIVSGQPSEVEGRIVTLDTVSLAKLSHQLVRRPQCPSCGDPMVVAAQQSRPVMLQSRTKNFTSDGGHRIFMPEMTVQKLEHHISPITGIVSLLQSNTTHERTIAPSYLAGHNFVHVSRDDSLDWDFLRASIRGASAGKGRSPAQAQASALGEAIERYSGVFQGDEERFRSRYKDLGAAAVHPNACMLFSEQQFKNREQWNAHRSWVNWVPEPFDENGEVEWSLVWSLTHDAHRYIPTASCYYGYSRKCAAWFARADSNGCASGHSKEEAILQGFMELVERDSVALWWYNRLKKPAVDLSSFAEPYFQELRAYYHSLHRDLWVLDITSDLNIPAYAALSRRTDQEREDIIFGFGAHFDPQIAILRALTEVNQALPVVFSGIPDDGDKNSPVDPQLVSWWKHATVVNQPHLVPDETSSPKVQADYPGHWSNDLCIDVMTCVQIAREKGLETLVLDQTRPDLGLNVVKVLVPGLRHFWPR